MHAGTIISGKYRLSREIGQGSMGSVWAAVHLLLDREVAIKFLNPSLEDEATAAARFVAEAKASALVKHRFVVDVFDFGISESGVSYMVQELLHGEPLSEVMCEGPAWSLRDATRFIMDCLTGLAAVHERGIVHRDLKPENIFVLCDSDGRVPKLLDFGISKSADVPRDKRVPRPSLRTSGRARLTAVGSTLGTPAYMSPEQLRNLNTVDARADIYSMGVVFYEWLVGHCPFATTMNFAVLVDRIEAREMQPLHVLRPDVGRDLCAVIGRAIEPHRELRYGSATELRGALAELLERLPPVQTKIQNDLPAYVPRGLPPPSISYRPKSLRSEFPPMRTAYSEGASLRPAGLRRGPSRSFWLGAVAVGLLLAAAPVAWRAHSHESTAPLAPHSAAPPASAAVPTLQTPRALEPAVARPDELPYGALPPDTLPDHEARPIEPDPVVLHDKLEDSAPALAEEHAPATPSRHHHRHHHAAHESSAAPMPEVTPSAARPKAAPVAAAPGQNKLLRSLDF
ncbi:MAG: serine/threonine protein kinase [Myxococcaceae bacterium]|nr:serine/threonine protein kinase [Myxococcaceae bacterium]